MTIIIKINKKLNSKRMYFYITPKPDRKPEFSISPVV
jgi:hypothetical protein